MFSEVLACMAKLVYLFKSDEVKESTDFSSYTI